MAPPPDLAAEAVALLISVLMLAGIGSIAPVLHAGREAERRYRRLFEHAPVMYATTYDQGGTPIIEDCNRLFLETLGYSRDQVIGRPLTRFYSPESSEDLMGGGYERALRGEFGEEIRELVTLDGERIDTLLQAVPRLDARDRVVGTHATFVDITEQRKAQAALRESEERYRTLFEQSIDAIYVTTRDGKVVDVNEAALELLGYSEEELLQMNAGQLYVDPERRRDFQREIETDGFVREFDIQLRRKDGTELDCLVSSTVRRTEEGEVFAYQGVIRDITERNRLQRQLSQARRMEAIGQLAGGIAHDFNNLLTGIRGHAELMLGLQDLDDAARADLTRIVTASERAAVLTQQLLAFGRRQPLELKVLNLNQVVEELENVLQRVLREDIEMIFELAPDLGNVKADPGQIDQILMNLSINASDAMPQGGRLTIKTGNIDLPEGYVTEYESAAPGPYVLLEVSDTGVGMDQETAVHIFEPFFTTKEQGKGTGLGLATVYGIVKQHGGMIFLDTRPGEGSTFRIYVPRVDQPVEKLAKSALDGKIEAPGSETILLTEDEDEVRSVTARILRWLGYQVFTAERASRALELAAEHHIDLLLTDVVLPDTNGVELAAELRRKEPGLKAVFISGYTDESEGESWVPDEDLFVAKPYTPRQLGLKVREALTRDADR